MIYHFNFIPMYCRHCNLNFTDGITECLQCHKGLEDTHYTQFLARKATQTFEVKDGVIMCLETGLPLEKKQRLFPAEKKANKERLTWQQKRDLAEQVETKAIDNYLSDYPMGHQTAEKAYFNTFKK